MSFFWGGGFDTHHGMLADCYSLRVIPSCENESWVSLFRARATQRTGARERVLPSSKSVGPVGPVGVRMHKKDPGFSRPIHSFRVFFSQMFSLDRIFGRVAVF